MLRLDTSRLATRHKSARYAARVGSFGDITFRVRYRECDPMGVAHHSVFPIWFEMGRTELLRESGMSYRELESQGFFIAVVKLSMSIRSPARYDDVLRLRTTLVKHGRVKLDHEYALYRAEELLATGSTVLACLDRLGAVQPLPDNPGGADRACDTIPSSPLSEEIVMPVTATQQATSLIEGASPTVFITDMNRAVRFYTETLGLTLLYRAGDHFAMIDAGGGCHIGLHPPGRRTPTPGAPGGIQIGLTPTRSIEEVVRELEHRGVRFRTDEQGRTVIDDSAVKLAFFADPDGNVLYLCEITR